jgi:ABC-2 type transport system ATP-binding protein
METTAQTDTLVTFENVAKNYHSFHALKDISFELKRGEIFGYIGPNGAGKTTSIKILVGLINRFNGNLTINGMAMPLKRNRILPMLGFLPQSVGFQNWRTVNHALMTFGMLSGMTKQELETRIPPLLERFDLGAVRHKKVKKLSGGMRQKVGFVQALLHRPQLLVLDEPLSGLDPASRIKLKEIIREVRDEGTTVMFSSHILSDVQDVVDRVGIINDGRIMTSGTLNELDEHFGLAKELEIRLSKIGNWEAIRNIAGIEKIEIKKEGHYMIEPMAGADHDVLTDQMIRELMNNDCVIRSIGPKAMSLDELYLRFVEGGKS